LASNKQCGEDEVVTYSDLPYVLGADGRVDVQSSTGMRTSLVLKNGGWSRLVPDSRKLVPLNETAFLVMLEYLVEG